MQDMYKKSFGA